MSKTVEIYFKDLNTEAQVHLLKEFDTAEGKENWDIAPLAILEREDDNSGNGKDRKETEFKPVDRVAAWRRFAQHMEKYIKDKTVTKYGLEKSGGFDLMSITQPIICVWCILRYALRIWNNRMKEHDLEKIAHYAEIAWTMSNGEIIKRNSIKN